MTHRWAGGDTKPSEKIEKDVKGFSLRLKKNLPFLTFSVPSKNPRCNDKWHKNVTLITLLIQVLLLNLLFSYLHPPVHQERLFFSHKFKVEMVGISKADSFFFVMFFWRNIQWF